MMKLRYRHYWLMGLTLVVAVFAYHLSDAVRWQELVPNYWPRAMTGLALAGVVAWQWRFYFHRRKYRHTSATAKTAHKYAGLAALPLFAVHAPGWGHGVAFLLSACLVLDCLVGLFNTEIFKAGSKTFYYAWLGTHIFLSVLIPILLVAHLYQVIWFHSPFADWSLPG